MKTVYAQANLEKVVLEEKEITAPGPGQVLLKAKYSAMSPGTENGLLGEHIVPLPTSIGYAMAAEVVEVGEGVEDLKVGDHVVTTGEHAQYLVMDELNCTICPEGVDLKQAAFWNLGHTGMYAIRRSGLQMGEPCAVFGDGFVGSVTAALASIAGAVPVIITGHHDERLAAAGQMGVDTLINTNTDPDGVEKAVEAIGWGGLPVIFEATGNRKALMQAAELVAERGRIVMISQVHGEAMPPIDDPIMQKGASLIGTYVNSKPYKLRRADLFITGTWPPVMGKKLARYNNADCWTSDEDIQVFLNLIKYGKLNVTPLISHQFDYTEIPEAYARFVSPKVDGTMTGGLICW
ncbi:MAG: zinc-binding alcohol dehydrogenase [Parasporobacterium sp.]|nr:zinc-binding alcohol dehydrogenase [Parasporobacterium sp.]